MGTDFFSPTTKPAVVSGSRSSPCGAVDILVVDCPKDCRNAMFYEDCLLKKRGLREVLCSCFKIRSSIRWRGGI